MTAERYKELAAFFQTLVDREIKTNVTLYMVDGTITSEEVSQRSLNLAEIAACIGTTYRAITGKELPV